jgi:hypothetical protein
LLALPLVAVPGTVLTRYLIGARAADRVPARLGHMTPDEARHHAAALCTRLTGGPCEALDLAVHIGPPTPGNPPHRVWEVSCRTAEQAARGGHSGGCTILIDAAAAELLLFRADREVNAETTEVVERKDRRLSLADVRRWARHYLALAGLPVPPGARPLPGTGTAVAYVYERPVAGRGTARQITVHRIEVRIDLSDARLLYLSNRPTILRFGDASRGQ